MVSTESHHLVGRYYNIKYKSQTELKNRFYIEKSLF